MFTDRSHTFSFSRQRRQWRDCLAPGKIYSQKAARPAATAAMAARSFSQPILRFCPWRICATAASSKPKMAGAGAGNNCKGKHGEDLIIKIPLGTLVKDASTQEILFDFTQENQTWKICAGGKGGKGNTRFKSSTNQAPLICTEGTLGQSSEVELELKLIADVGFVGMPNAGKSTLISQLAHIEVNIAPYPFTTLKPNLGMIVYPDSARLLIADIPGIIENAHQNRGLGLEFLRHIERCAALVFVIELSPWEEARDPLEEFQMLKNEIASHNPKLLEKPFLIALNKMDIEGADELARSFHKRAANISAPIFEISALNGDGCQELKTALHAFARKKPSDIESLREILL